MSVYFAQAGPYLKVGFSADPVSRMTTVTRNGRRPADLAHGADARLLGWIPGDMHREMELHVRFADRRASGEWFTIAAAEVRDLIWSDPRGVDLERMSAQAVFAATAYPEATRDDLAAAGIRVEAAPLDEATAAMDGWLSGLFERKAAS